MPNSYTVMVHIQSGPPVVFNEGSFPPYVLSVGDQILFQPDSDTLNAGWALQGLALTFGAWNANFGAPILLGGAFKNVQVSALSGTSDLYQLPGYPTSITLQYITGAYGNGIGFILEATSNMQNVIIQIGISLTAKNAAGEVYATHDPQVILPPQH